MFALVGEQGDYHMAFAESLRNFQRRAARGARRDADQKAFLGGQPARVLGGFLIADRNNFVEYISIQHGRNKAGTNALNLMITRFAAGDDR